MTRTEIENFLFEMRAATEAKKPTLSGSVARGAAMLAPVKTFTNEENDLIDRCDAHIEKMGEIFNGLEDSDPATWQETANALQLSFDKLDDVQIPYIGEIGD